MDAGRHSKDSIENLLMIFTTIKLIKAASVTASKTLILIRLTKAVASDLNKQSQNFIREVINARFCKIKNSLPIC